MSIIHFGTVLFENGNYQRQSGSPHWQVRAIDPQDIPVGQSLIEFASPLTRPYSVIITAYRLDNTPLLIANYGDVTPQSFVVHLGEIIADRTVQNAHFSFLVLSE